MDRKIGLKPLLDAVPPPVLRLVSALAIGTSVSILVGATVVFWPLPGPSEVIQYGVVLVATVCAITLSSVMLIRNRPFFVGLSFLLSIAGALVFGLVGVGVLVYCVLSLLAPGSFIPPSRIEWFFGVNNAIMAALPICWAFIWRDYRNHMADQHLTKRETV
jgi:hypothetical protein